MAILLVFLLDIKELNYSNIMPMVDQGWQPVWHGAFSAFSFPFAEAILFTAIFTSVKGKKSLVNVFMVGLLISGGLLLLITLQNIFMLGPYTMSNVYFLTYSAVGRINIGEFIQRIEGSMAIIFVICIFMKLAVCLMAASKGIAKLFGLSSYRSVVMQTGLLTAYLAYVIYDNIMEMQYWAQHIYSYYALPFQVIIPVILLVFSEIKVRRSLKAKPQ